MSVQIAFAAPLRAASAFVILLVGGCSAERTTTDGPRAGEAPGSGQTSGTAPTSIASPGTDTADYGCFMLKSSANGWDVVEIPKGGGLPTPRQSFPSTVPPSIFDITWFDGRWWTCHPFVGALDPATGASTETNMECYGMFTFEDELYVHRSSDPHSAWLRFASTDDVLEAGPVGTLYRDGWETFTMASAFEGTLYTAVPSSDSVYVVRPESNTGTEVPLVGYSAWVTGIGVSDVGVVRLLDDGRGDPNGTALIRDFDRLTGVELDRVAVGTWTVDTLRGLWCGSPN